MATIDRAAQVAQVISLLEDGSSEHAACLKVGINRNTFRSQALKIGAGDDYAKALSALAQAQVEKLEQAIDDMRDGTYDPKAARVEIDARKWFASKFLPKRYGDKQQVEHSGNVGSSTDPIQVMEQLVQMAATHPTQNPMIRKWLKECLSRIPPLEGGD